MLRSSHLLAGSLWLITVSFIALGCRNPSVQPNVILITIDTLRADRLSCYGYVARKTPHLDQLAADGVLFERAFCDVTWTTPSMASVMTGTYATVHGLKSTTVHRLRDEAVTLAEVLREHGYHTTAVVGSFPVDHVFGLNQGFEKYDDDFTQPLIAGDAPIQRVPSVFKPSGADQDSFNVLKAFNDSRRSDAEVTAAATEWLRSDSQRPFFLWVHYFGPHDLPDSRKNYLQNLAEQVNRYDARLAETDRAVGELLQVVDDLALTRDTLVVLHADHGESLGEHDAVGHGMNLYEQALQIPLIVRLPGKGGAGSRVRKLVRNVDIFATVLDFLHIPLDHPINGESLVPLLLYPDLGREIRSTYTESYFPAQKIAAPQVTLPDGSTRRMGVVHRGIRGVRWKYVRTEPRPIFGFEAAATEIPKAVQDTLNSDELYDLALDPLELHNVAAQRPEVVTALRARLDEQLQIEAQQPSAPKVNLDDAGKERLRSLGYAN